MPGWDSLQTVATVHGAFQLAGLILLVVVAALAALAAYQLALEKCGSIKLARALEPGRKAAADGFEISASYGACFAARIPTSDPSL